jgi:hypothetical protein
VAGYEVISTAKGDSVRRMAGVLMVVALGGGMVACDGDSGSGGSIQAYCDLVAELNERSEAPTDAQLGDLKEAAPSEISDSVETVTDAIAGADTAEEQQALGSDPDLRDAVADLEEFDEENCQDEKDKGTEDGGTEEENNVETGNEEGGEEE